MIGNSLGIGIANLVGDAADGTVHAIRKFGETLEHKLGRKTRYAIGGLATALTIAGTAYGILGCPEIRPSPSAQTVLKLEREKKYFISNINDRDNYREQVLRIPQIKSYLDSLDREIAMIKQQPGVSDEVTYVKTLEEEQLYGFFGSLIGMSSVVPFSIYFLMSEFEEKRKKLDDRLDYRHEHENDNDS